jgi:hypothetical protein
MKKFIKTGLLFIVTMFVLSIAGLQVSNADGCEDLCTPKENKTCTARGGATCSGFEDMSTIDPIPPDL